MRILGIDFGTKKVGTALSDPEGFMGFPYRILPNDGALIQNLRKIVIDEGVEKIVVGYSANLNGSPNLVQEDIDKFVTILGEETGLLPELEPEFLSTAQARRGQEETGAVDAAAATIILNSYLERNRDVNQY